MDIPSMFQRDGSDGHEEEDTRILCAEEGSTNIKEAEDQSDKQITVFHCVNASNFQERYRRVNDLG
jgi:hypothetical protein